MREEKFATSSTRARTQGSQREALQGRRDFGDTGYDRSSSGVPSQLEPPTYPQGSQTGC